MTTISELVIEKLRCLKLELPIMLDILQEHNLEDDIKFLNYVSSALDFMITSGFGYANSKPVENNVSKPVQVKLEEKKEGIGKPVENKAGLPNPDAAARLRARFSEGKDR